MALKDIKKDLHKRDSQYAQRGHEKTQYAVDAPRTEKAQFRDDASWGARARRFTREHQVAVLFGGLALLVMVLGLAAIIAASFFQQSFFQEGKVGITVEGPEVIVDSGMQDYTITIVNNNRAELRDVELIVRHGETFMLAEASSFARVSTTSSALRIPVINGNTSQAITFSGVFFSTQESILPLTAVMRYMPERTTTIYAAQGEHTVRVAASLMDLQVAGPVDVYQGNDIEYVIRYKNVSNTPLKNQQLVITPPKGFRTLQTDPPISRDSLTWTLDPLAPGEGGQVRLRGRIDGRVGEDKRLTAMIQTQQNDRLLAIARKAHVFGIQSLPLSVEQTVTSNDGVVRAGDVLTYRIRYANNGTIGLRDVILTLDFDTEVLDFSRLALQNGSLNAEERQITWRAVDVPDFASLEAGASGVIEFTVPVRAVLPISDEDDKNFAITSFAQIDSPDLPTPIDRNKIIVGQTMELKVQSPVVIATEGFYYDPVLSNTGPIPPVQGQETTYTIVWTLANAANDLENVTVTSALPSGVEWKDVTRVPQGDVLEFNERTNSITWRVGRVESGTGVLREPLVARFQIGITPSVDQVNSSPTLLNTTTVSGRDLFTQKDIFAQANEKTTVLPEDQQLGTINARVEGQ